MFTVSAFERYCQDHGVAVIPYRGCPAPGATVRDHGLYAVFLDFSKICSTRLLRGVCCHELGHLATGALHKVSSPYEIAERSEHRAIRWTAEHFLTWEEFQKAFSAGYTQPWELSEYFDLPEEDVMNAYAYWVDCKGCSLPESN